MTQWKRFTCMCIVLCGLTLVSLVDKGGGDETVPDGIIITETGILDLDIRHTFGRNPLNFAPQSYITQAN